MNFGDDDDDDDGGFGEFRETIICAASWPEGQGAEGILQGTIKGSPLDIEASQSRHLEHPFVYMVCACAVGHRPVFVFVYDGEGNE